MNKEIASLAQFNEQSISRLQQLASTVHGANFLHDCITYMGPAIQGSSITTKLNSNFANLGLPVFEQSTPTSNQKAAHSNAEQTSDALPKPEPLHFKM